MDQEIIDQLEKQLPSLQKVSESVFEEVLGSYSNLASLADPRNPILKSEPRAEEISNEDFIAAPGFTDMGKLFEKPARHLSKVTPVMDSTVSPFNGIGRLFVTTPGGFPSSGSAWIIGDEWICTAAHVIVNSSGWCRNVVFVPGFNQYQMGPLENLSPSKAYQIQYAKVQPWFLRNNGTNPTKGHTAFDIALCKVARPFDASLARIPIKTMSNFDVFESNEIAMLGYPGDLAFDFGQHMWQCIGEYIYRERQGTGSPYCPVNSSGLGVGVSGGPWLTEIEEKYYSVGLCSATSNTGSNPAMPLATNPNKISIMSSRSPFFDTEVFDDLATQGVEHNFQTITI